MTESKRSSSSSSENRLGAAGFAAVDFEFYEQKRSSEVMLSYIRLEKNKAKEIFRLTVLTAAFPEAEKRSTSGSLSFCCA